MNINKIKKVLGKHLEYMETEEVLIKKNFVHYLLLKKVIQQLEDGYYDQNSEALKHDVQSLGYRDLTKDIPFNMKPSQKWTGLTY